MDGSTLFARSRPFFNLLCRGSGCLLAALVLPCVLRKHALSAELERDVPLRVVVDLDLAEAEGEEKGEEVWLSS